jgi:S1-C subfamily serine protease
MRRSGWACKIGPSAKSVCYSFAAVHFRAVTIPSKIKKLVAGATFKIQTRERGSGQCILIVGGLIITAAHCVDMDCTGRMALAGKFYWSKIQTDGGDLIATTRAVEPVSDIAVLGSPDPADLPETEAFAFEEWSEHIAPVKLLRKIPKERQPFPVWIRTHHKTWVVGTAYYGGNSTFAYTTDIEIRGGTSGGPIVNREGELVGVVSHGTTTCVKGRFYSAAGLLPLALPVWVIARTRAGRG